ncbi:MAG: hypothetical protein NTX91_02315 [candidate division SR1 bacterium]|nr:hypothetical protein [candidate division SR1 bacterium]
MKTTGYKIRVASSGGSNFSSLFTSKNIGGLVILLLIAVVAVVFYYSSDWLKGKENSGTKSYEFSSSLLTGSKVPIPSTFTDDVCDLLKYGTAVKVDFRVENGDALYESTWTSPDTIMKFTQTNERFDYFNNTLLEGLKKQIDAYNAACKQTARRTICIAIDVTNGWKSHFNFNDVLDKNDIAWLRDPNKEASLYVYAIGYNPIPGHVDWDKTQGTTLESMEIKIQAFLSQVKSALPNTSLISNVHYIMDKIKGSNQPLFVLQSDLLENTKELSAYRQDKAYKNFVDLNPEFIASYKTISATAAQVTIDPSATGEIKLLLPSGQNSALGRDAKKQKWYTAFKSYLELAYPGCKVNMSY